MSQDQKECDYTQNKIYVLLCWMKRVKGKDFYETL